MSECALAEVAAMPQIVEDADVTPEDSSSDLNGFDSHKHQDSDLGHDPGCDKGDDAPRPHSPQPGPSGPSPPLNGTRDQEQEEDGSSEDFVLAPMPPSPASPGLQAEAPPPPATVPREEDESQPQQNGASPLPKRPKRALSRTAKYSMSEAEGEGEEDEEYQPPVCKLAVLTPSKKVTKSPMISPSRRQSRLASETPVKRGGSAENDRWRNMEEEDTAPPLRRFVPARPPGPVLDRTETWTPLELFQLYFSSNVVNTIIKNTNCQAQRQRQAGKKYPWRPLNVKDFFLFLSIIIYMGIVSLPQHDDYWKKGFPYGHPFPANTMTRARFEAIMWSLHMSDPTKKEENDRKRNTPEYDKLFNIKPLYTDIVAACKSFFQPYRDISIDERMVPSKARISIKQYHKDKPTKWGYKLYVLADSSTGYTWNFFVYSGKGSIASEQGLGYTSVMDLMPFSLLGSGYSLYVDNFYTSPELFTDLVAKNTQACGTIRQNRSGFPKTSDNDLPRNAQMGDMRWIRKDNLLFMKWMDKRQVSMCSTFHKAYSGETTRRKVKEDGVWQIKHVPCPDAILAYNKNMGGVDLSDALIGYYSVLHKTMKWYKTFFYHFVDIATVNSHILHKELVKARADGTKPLTQKQFRETLCQEMITFAKGLEPSIRAPRKSCMPMFLGPSAHTKRKFCIKCSEAGKKRVRSSVYCRKCDVALCLMAKKNCFTEWHDAK